MKISTILDHVDSGHWALPEFQRGYVWNRGQVRDFFESLYRKHPVGSLLVWMTEARSVGQRGGNQSPPGPVSLLLDGQQRITSLYGVIRGRPPRFFDGNPRAFTDLRFHAGEERFAFFQPVIMRDDTRWIDVAELMQAGTDGLGDFVQEKLSGRPDYASEVGNFFGRLNKLLGIREANLHIEEVTGQDMTLDIVVGIFDRVNSGGTKLSKGDLALAKICAEWPQAREDMRSQTREWSEKGYKFTFNWLLQSVNAILTGKAQFAHLERAKDFPSGLEAACRHIDGVLGLVAGRLGLDHNRVLFGRYAMPVMVRHMHRKNGRLSAQEQDKLLFWFVQSGMRGRFSGSTETVLDKDLAALEGKEGGLDALVRQLQEYGNLRIGPNHFSGWGLGARFYPVLYMLTRMGGARDWGNGLPLDPNRPGSNNLERHHIFPKAQLVRHGYGSKQEMHATANFCLLRQDTNLDISDRLPEDYFAEVEAKHPGALESQWIPEDKSLWKIENYRGFLEARRELLAAEANRHLEDLLHGDTHLMTGSPAPAEPERTASAAPEIRDEDEAAELEGLNNWMQEQGLPAGEIYYDYADPHTGAQKAVFDLVWPEGLQPGLSRPVAILLDEPHEMLELASAAGYRCFTSTDAFRNHVSAEVLGQD